MPEANRGDYAEATKTMLREKIPSFGFSSHKEKLFDYIFMIVDSRELSQLLTIYLLEDLSQFLGKEHL